MLFIQSLSEMTHKVTILHHHMPKDFSQAGRVSKLRERNRFGRVCNNNLNSLNHEVILLAISPLRLCQMTLALFNT